MAALPFDLRPSKLHALSGHELAGYARAAGDLALARVALDLCSEPATVLAVLRRFDLDGTGLLAQSAFRLALAKLAPGAAADARDALFAAFDVRSSHLVDVEMVSEVWLHWARELLPPEPAAEPAAAAAAAAATPAARRRRRPAQYALGVLRQQLDAVQAACVQLDVNYSGAISRDELALVFEHVGLALTPEERADAEHALGLGAADTVQIQPLLARLGQHASREGLVHLQRVWDALRGRADALERAAAAQDLAGAGSVDAAQFRRALAECSVRLSDADFADVWGRLPHEHGALPYRALRGQLEAAPHARAPNAHADAEADVPTLQLQLGSPTSPATAKARRLASLESHGFGFGPGCVDEPPPPPTQPPEPPPFAVSLESRDPRFDLPAPAPAHRTPARPAHHTPPRSAIPIPVAAQPGDGDLLQRMAARVAVLEAAGERDVVRRFVRGDRRGLVARADLMRTLSLLGLRAHDGEVELLFWQLDPEGTGSVRRDRMVRALAGGASPRGRAWRAARSPEFSDGDSSSEAAEAAAAALDPADEEEALARHSIVTAVVQRANQIVLICAENDPTDSGRVPSAVFGDALREVVPGIVSADADAVVCAVRQSDGCVAYAGFPALLLDWDSRREDARYGVPSRSPARPERQSRARARSRSPRRGVRDVWREGAPQRPVAYDSAALSAVLYQDPGSPSPGEAVPSLSSGTQRRAAAELLRRKVELAMAFRPVAARSALAPGGQRGKLNRAQLAQALRTPALRLAPDEQQAVVELVCDVGRLRAVDFETLVGVLEASLR